MMEPEDIELDASDLVEVLDGFEQTIKNLPMELYATLFMGKVDEMFESEGAAGEDGPWQPLTEETLRRHPRRRGGQILSDTGATAAGVQHFEVQQTMQFASGTAYGAHHLAGTEHMVKRDFFAIRMDVFLEELGSLVLQEMP